MTYRLIIAGGLLGSSFLAHGEEAPRLGAAECRVLVHHEPAPDVAYRPSPNVVPADLDAKAPPDPVAIDLKRYDGAAQAAGTIGRELTVGRITIEPQADGTAQVRFNGKPLPEVERARLAEACAKRS